MRLAVLKERRAGETRVAATPETVRKLTSLGLTVAVEAGAGAGASIPDADFQAAGAEIAADAAAVLHGAGVVFAVQPPETLSGIQRGALLVCISGAMADRDTVPAYAAAGIDVAAMELLPRITRAQSMDILSSQANLAGYRAVIEGAGAFDRGFPMMMTAAGTVPPARVFVVGAGVAGLQAIATARRLGAIVSATDVRPAAKEEIKSLGANFVGVEDTETAGQTGAYAKEMSAEFRQKQAELMAATVAKNDMVICTALVQGGRAPVLVTQAMVDAMKPGSVVVDLASDGGGNCEATRPGEAYVTDRGVKILGYRNWPGRISVSASQLYAKNLLTFLTSFWDKDAHAPKLPADDAIVQGVMLTRGGAVVHASFADPAKAPPPIVPDAVSEPVPESAPAPVVHEEHPSAASATVPGTPAAAPVSHETVSPEPGPHETGPHETGPHEPGPHETEAAPGSGSGPAGDAAVHADPVEPGIHGEMPPGDALPEHEAASPPAGYAAAADIVPAHGTASASAEPTASGIYGEAASPEALHPEAAAHDTGPAASASAEPSAAGDHGEALPETVAPGTAGDSGEALLAGAAAAPGSVPGADRDVGIEHEAAVMPPDASARPGQARPSRPPPKGGGGGGGAGGGGGKRGKGGGPKGRSRHALPTMDRRGDAP